MNQKEANDLIDEACVAIAKGAQDAAAEMDRLRGELAEARDNTDREVAMLAALTLELAEARAERDAYKKAKERNDERFMRERDEARAERDARPEITPEDAAAWIASMPNFYMPIPEQRRVHDALRAHAGKVAR